MTIPQKVATHRANLFSAICQIVSTEYQPRIPAEVFPMTNRRLNAPTHNLRVLGKSVFFGMQSLDLSAAPMTLLLYRAFLESPMHRLNRFELARAIYGIEDPTQCSERFWAATRLNITKLISRARKQAKENLSVGFPTEINWFPHNSVEDAWELMLVKDRSRH